MNNYYFVVPSLPVLRLGEIPDFSFKELIYRLEMNLSKKDRKQVATIRRLVDLQNIKALYLKKHLDDHGNLSEKELDEALLVEADLPGYVFEFLNQFEESKEKTRNFFGLLSRFYTYEISKAKGFLKSWLILQREMRLVLAAVRAKKLGRDIINEFQFEDFTDPLVAEIISQKDLEIYDPPMEYRELFEQISTCEKDPWLLYQTIIKYEFEKIEELTDYPLFSLDWILGYVARFLLIEKWNRLNPHKGKEILDRYKTGF